MSFFTVLHYLGDVCDPDRDGDGINNSIDNCPYRVNILQTDLNGMLLWVPLIDIHVYHAKILPVIYQNNLFFK